MATYKVFPIPSDSRWCIYLDYDKKPCGVGHLCKGFETGYAVMTLFNLLLQKRVEWVGTKCTHCHEEIPKDMKSMLRFILL